MAFKKAQIERALGAELSHHLGYGPGATKPEDAVNHRNGASGKTVLTEDGPLRIEVPRDRQGSFEPLLIPSTTGASPASTTRSWPCTRAA
jgi:transposase-like protein